MPTAERNRSWALDAFLDSLVRDLDDWQETLAVKGITRPLTYTVQDVALELQCFPQFDGDEVRFVTAAPGQEGASSLRFQLGSITASSIRDTAPPPVSRDDTVIQGLDLEPETKAALTKAGIKTARDLERVRERNVDISAVTEGKVRDYSDLASMINKARREVLQPSVHSVALDDGGNLVLTGQHLSVGMGGRRFPKAALDGRPVEVVRATADQLVLAVGGPPAEPRRVDVALDPYAVVSMELRP